MKTKLFLFVFSCLFSMQLIAQCGFETSPGEPANPFTGDLSQESYNIRIYFVLIRKDDGSGIIQDNIIPGMMQELDNAYGPHGITFSLQCTRYIDSTRWYDNGRILEGSINKVGASYGTYDGITVFVQANAGEHKGAAATPMGTPFCWLQYQGTQDIVAHEVGHILDLYHTWHKSFGLPCVGNMEHDTTRGDLVADTPVEVEGTSVMVRNCQWDTSICRLLTKPDTCLDACGNYLQSDPTIIMTYLLSGDCTTHFTPGQANRMKNCIKTNKGGTYYDLQTAPLIVTNYVLINTIFNSARNITIKNGGILEVQSTIFMPPQTKIIIEPGGQLFINGGKITLNSKIKDACNPHTGDSRFWYGIEMQPGTNNATPRFHCTNGTIELSEYGVHTSQPAVAGNIIIGVNSGTFKDNKHAFHLLRMPGISTPLFISNARFYHSSMFPLANYYTQVKVDNARIFIADCLFENPSNKVPLNDAEFCVSSFNTQLSVQRSVFKQKLNGVVSSTLLSASTLSISNSKFDDLIVGVKTNTGINNYVITTDTFNSCAKYGIESNQCSGYIINTNHFTNNKNYNNPIGINMAESGSGINSIRNNFFQQLKYGNAAVGDNGDFRQGLQYLCNTNDFSKVKEIIVSGTIGGLQGSESNAAGNTALNDVQFDLNGLSLPRIDYYHLDNAQERPNAVPSSKMGKIIAQIKDCKIPGKPGPGDTHIGEYYKHGDTLSGFKTIYQQAIDGGNTTDLLQTIANAGNGSILYNQLQVLAPWLSQASGLAAYNRSDILDNSQRFNLLLNNPDLFRSPAYRQALSEANNPLPESQLLALDTLTLVQTVRTDLEATIEERSQIMSAICYDKLYELKMDTTQATLVQQAEWLDRVNDISAKREMIELQFEVGNYTTAINMVNTLIASGLLSATQVADFNELNNVVAYLEDVKSDGRYEGRLTPAEQDYLSAFCYGKSNHTAKEIQAMLWFYYGIDASGNQNIVSSDGNQWIKKSETLKTTQTGLKQSSKDWVLYPNPGKDYLNIHFVGQERDAVWNIYVWDLQGRLWHEAECIGNMAKINLDRYNDGLYIIQAINQAGQALRTTYQINH